MVSTIGPLYFVYCVQLNRLNKAAVKKFVLAKFDRLGMLAGFVEFDFGGQRPLT